MKRSPSAKPFSNAKPTSTSGTSTEMRAPRPRVRQDIPLSADRALMVDPDDPDNRVPFISDEGADIVETMGRQIEPDYRARATNPSDAAPEFKPTR